MSMTDSSSEPAAASGTEAQAPTSGAQEPFAPDSPALTSAWLLRSAAILSVGAAILGIILSPGLRGNAPGVVVDAADRAAQVLGYVMYGLLLVLVVRATVEILRLRRLSAAPRVVVVTAAGIVLAAAAPSLWARLPERLAEALGLAAATAAMVSAGAGLRAPHTRAVGGVLGAFALAAFVRLSAFELATFAGEHASVRLFEVSRGFATCGIVFEAIGQLVAATWLGTRARLSGQLLSSAALAGAFIVTWGAAAGVHAGAAPWQAVLHTALSDAAGVPRPFAYETLGAVATFLVAASMLLALVAAAQPGQVVVVISTLALALLARGAFDAPLRGMAASAAALWIVLASADERAMWKALMGDRVKRGLPLR
jgi:hypothetical protein